MDIDHFKLVNDTFGHPFGDFVLQELCGVLGRVFRDSDTLYRYGGEEFCALMPETQCTEGETVAIRVLEAVRKHVFDDGQQSLKLTISIGGAIFPDCDQESLIQSADQALYRAKREGRNRVIFS
jgi:diguanylate cyclase (GGDEF)-like protein